MIPLLIVHYDIVHPEVLPNHETLLNVDLRD